MRGQSFQQSGFCMQRRLGVVLLLLLALGGCYDQGPSKYKVTGSVMWEGEPIPDGYVVFQPLDRDFTDDAGPIKEGTFEFEATAGEKRVQIHASRPDPSGKVDPAMGMVARQVYIPSHYNSETTLTATVKSDGENKFEYKLTNSPTP
jgi:hypothetical protein